MPHFGQKTGFRARNAGMNEIKSGIPCSGLVAIGWLIDDAFVFGKSLHGRIQNTRMR
jgi:hypothetical protein